MTHRLTLLTRSIDDCWNRIGVKGDHSCPKLADLVHCHNCPLFAEAARALLDRPPPEGYLEEATLLLGESGAAQKAAEELSVVVFEVEEELLAIDTKTVVEVTEPRQVHRMPHRTGRVFSGLVNVHGQLELCASLQGLLQIAKSFPASGDVTRRPRMLLVEHGGPRWVFGVDAMHGVQRFARTELLEVPAATLHNAGAFVKQLLRWESRHIGLLDVEKTFSALEKTIR
jgi:chemotaxis-related protein WspD